MQNKNNAFNTKQFSIRPPPLALDSPLQGKHSEVTTCKELGSYLLFFENQQYVIFFK